MQLIGGLQLNSITLQNIENLHDLSLLAEAAKSWRLQKHYLKKMVLELATPVRRWALWFFTDKRAAKILNKLVAAHDLYKKDEDSEVTSKEKMKQIVSYLAVRVNKTVSELKETTKPGDIEAWTLELTKLDIQKSRDLLAANNPSQDYIRDLDRVWRELEGRTRAMIYSGEPEEAPKKAGRIVELPGIEHPFRSMQ
jgi:hypothetical protein